MSVQKSDIANAIAETDNSTFVVGEAVFIRTVTYHMIGRVARISKEGQFHFLHLEDASWIPDTEEFHKFINNGALREVQAVDTPVRVAVAAIVDVFGWNHPLPRTSK